MWFNEQTLMLVAKRSRTRYHSTHSKLQTLFIHDENIFYFFEMKYETVILDVALISGIILLIISEKIINIDEEIYRLEILLDD